MAARKLGIPLRDDTPYGRIAEGMSLIELGSQINTLTQVQNRLLKRVSPQSNPERQ